MQKVEECLRKYGLVFAYNGLMKSAEDRHSFNEELKSWKVGENDNFILGMFFQIFGILHPSVWNKTFGINVGFSPEEKDFYKLLTKVVEISRIISRGDEKFEIVIRRESYRIDKLLLLFEKIPKSSDILKKIELRMMFADPKRKEREFCVELESCLEKKIKETKLYERVSEELLKEFKNMKEEMEIETLFEDFWKAKEKK